MLSYPSGLQVSTRALTLLTDALRAHRVQLHSQWRALLCGRQALLVLARLRKNEAYPDLAAGFAIGVATVCRYVHEALDLLSVMAPTLADAVQTAACKAYVVLEGTVVRIDRVFVASRRDGPYYSGKAHADGVNVQVLADPAGRLIWASPALPGAVHDVRAARAHHLPPALAQAGVTTFADKGYQGAGPGSVSRAGPGALTPTPAGTCRYPATKGASMPPTPDSAPPASGPALNSRPSASCASSTPAPPTPPTWSTPFKP